MLRNLWANSQPCKSLSLLFTKEQCEWFAHDSIKMNESLLLLWTKEWPWAIPSRRSFVKSDRSDLLFFKSNSHLCSQKFARKNQSPNPEAYLILILDLWLPAKVHKVQVVWIRVKLLTYFKIQNNSQDVSTSSGLECFTRNVHLEKIWNSTDSTAIQVSPVMFEEEHIGYLPYCANFF